MSVCLKIPKLTNCCCCVNLRSGAITLTVLNVIGSIILLIPMIVALAAVGFVDGKDLPPDSHVSPDGKE